MLSQKSIGYNPQGGDAKKCPPPTLTEVFALLIGSETEKDEKENNQYRTALR